MRSFLMVIMYVLLCLETPAWCQESNDVFSKPPGIQRILDRGKLVVAMLNRESPPFFYTNTKGEFVGADVDIAKGIAKDLGVELEFRRTARTYNELLNVVMQPDVDVVISNFSKTTHRARHLLFTNTYLEENLMVFVNRKKMAGVDLESVQCPILRKVKLSVIRGSSFVQRAHRCFPNAEIFEADSPRERDNLVLTGVAIGAVADETYYEQAFAIHPEYALYMKAMRLDARDETVLAVPWNCPGLRDYLNVFLEQNGINYTVDELYAKYPLPGMEGRKTEN